MRSTTELRQLCRGKWPRLWRCGPSPSTRLAGLPWARHVIGMAEKDKEREERLAAALRENLRRRKAQARDLDAGEPKPEKGS